MQLSTQIQIDRQNAEGECIMVDVDVTGTFETYGSANPHERGIHLGSWDAVDASTGEAVILDSDEKYAAVEALYREV